MSKKMLYTNKNSSKLFDENISFLEEQIKTNNTDFILILPNRKLIKNIRNKFLKKHSVLCDVKIWTFDDLVSASDISSYMTDLIIRLSIESLIEEGVFEDNKFFKSKGLIDAAKKFISICKYSNKDEVDLEKWDNYSISIGILIKIYKKYQSILNNQNISDKFDYYKCKNINLQKSKDIYIHGFSEFRPIELETIKFLENFDVNINIFMDYYSDYKSNLKTKLQEIGFEVLDSTDSTENCKILDKKIVKITNEILEKDRLIYEISEDSFKYDYDKMAILVEKDETKKEIINTLKNKGIPVFSDDYICHSDFKIYSDIINLLDKSKNFKQYVFSMLDSCLLCFELNDKIKFRNILIDYEFDDWNSLSEILKLNVNYEINIKICQELKKLYDFFNCDNHKLISNIVNILENTEIELQNYKLFTEKLLIILEELQKTYDELVKQIKNIEGYLTDVIVNLRVDSADYLVDGIRIYNLTNIRLSEYDVLYIVNMNDDVIPGKVSYNFFFNEDNIDYLKGKSVDVLSDKDNRQRNIDRYFDAINRTKNKLYISYNTENKIKSRLLSEKQIHRHKKTKKVVKISNKIENKIGKNITLTRYDKFSLKNYLNQIETKSETKNIEDFVVDEKTTRKIIEGELSPTKLETYFQCPMKFYFKYYLNLKSDSKSRNLVLGNVLHNTLEEFYGINIEKIKNAVDSCTDIDTSSLDKLLKNSFEKYGLNVNIKENEFDYEKYLIKLDDFIKQDINKMTTEFEKFYPFKLEEEFKVKIGSHTFCGRIDRVDKSDNGNIRLIDYKLSNNSFKKLRDLEKNEGFQFAIYKSYGNVLSCKYKSIEDNDEYEFLQNTKPEELDDIVIEKTNEFIDNLKNKKLFIKAHDDRTCVYCDYSKICRLRNQKEIAND